MAQSSDEGEIVEDGPVDMKATSLSRVERSGVDRRDRHPNRHLSNEDDGSRHSSRGYKRGHDDYNSRDRHRHPDTRRDRHHESDSRDGYKRSRVSYDELDYSDAGRSSRDDGRGSRDDRDRNHRHRDRRRSRSPPRQRREETAPVKSIRFDTENPPKQVQRDAARTGEVAGILKNAEPEPDVDYDAQTAYDEEAEIERRRKRREQLMAKSSSATPLLLHAVGAATDKSRAESPASSTLPGTPQMEQSEPQTSSSKCNRVYIQLFPLANRSDIASPQSPNSRNSPARLDLASDFNIMNMHSQANADDDGPSAADYDPTVDMQEDERRDGLRNAAVMEAAKPAVAAKDEDEDDENFDMFADDFDEDKYATKPDSAAVVAKGDDGAEGGILEGDDREGYYKMRIGEVINNRYQIQSTLGKGMFSGVVGAIDVTTKTPVAIKMIRNNDALRKAGYTEIAILQKLNDADPEGRKHIVKFERSFEFRGHLCMAFENLSMNLREVLRKFGNNVGINLSATRTYAYQIFVALAHMRKCTIIHADLKPDNILVNETRSVLKICDLGTAIDRSDAATAHTGITPYLVSRFYRAPEIILGMEYDYGVDMWSIGCTLYELYTGKILFTGDSNNQMLKAIMEVRGRLTPKLFKRGQLAGNHFDELGQFVSVEHDKVLSKVRSFLFFLFLTFAILLFFCHRPLLPWFTCIVSAVGRRG